MAANYLLYDRFIKAMTNRGASKEELMSIMRRFEGVGHSTATFERILKELRGKYRLTIEYRRGAYYLEWDEYAQRLARHSQQLQTYGLLQSLEDTPQLFDFGIMPAQIGMSGFEELGKAMKNHEWVSIQYRSFTSKETNVYELRPLFLKLWNNRWYLIAKKRGVDDTFRNFGLDRIVDVQTMNEYFEPREGEEKKAYSHVIGTSDAEKPAEHIVIETNQHGFLYINALKLHPSQRAEESEEGRYRIHLDVVPNRELMEILATMNQPICIVEPLSFRQAYTERLTKQLRHNCVEM